MFKKHLLTALAFASVALGITFEEAAEAPPLELKQPPGKFIIELEDNTNASDNDFEAFRQQGLDFSINNQFDSPIFNGVSLDVRNSTARTLEDIKALPGIKDAWQASYVTLEFSAQDASTPKWNPHALTGVDKVHLENILGEGINVAVIDSGVDYGHSSLSGSLVQGYDFTKDPRNPSNDASDCIGHGTFVSSIIASHSDVLAGVAPKAKIKMYKVFGCYSMTTDDIILAALIKAYSENPDVISLSLGSDRGYPSVPVSIVSAKIAQTIPVVYAAGNSGNKGLYRASSGASGKGVVAVASVEANQLLSWTGTLYSSGGASTPFQYISNDGSNPQLEGTFGVDYVGDLCTARGSKNGSNKIMAGYVGNCYFQDIYETANNRNYAGVILFVPQTNLKYSRMNLSNGNLRFWAMSTNDALKWIQGEAKRGGSFKAHLTRSDESSSAVSKPDAYSGVINTFTSWGPTFDQGFYPHIAAPGGDVLGAKMGGGFSISSGTSFACPYITGVLSLYLSANGRINPQELRTRLISSGRLMAQTVSSQKGIVTDKNEYAPLIQQGNGIVDVFSLFETKSKLLTSPYLELNDTTHRVSEHTITVMNEGDNEIKYNVSSIGLKTLYAKGDKLGNVASYYPELVTESPKVAISQTTFSIPARGQVSFKVSITPPNNLDSSRAPILQGAIDINGDNGDLITVPFMGVEINTHDDWAAWADKPLIVAKDDKGVLRNLTSYQHSFSLAYNDSPLIFQNIRFGSKFVSFDLVLTNFDLRSYKYSMKKGTNGFYGPLLTNSFQGYQIAFPITFTEISSQVSVFGIQRFTDGSKIQSGSYKILCRSLKPFGSYEVFEDWQLYLSDPFTVRG